MHRFYLPPDQCKNPPLFLTGREAHHALRVLRLRRGDQVMVLDGAGAQLLCSLEQYDRDKVALGVIERRFVAPLPYQITLLQAVPKGKLFESIIQKATELGVYRIVPLLSERVVAAPNRSGEKGLKAERWRLASVEAIKQCGSTWLPRIESPTTPQEFLARHEHFDLALVASLRADARHPSEYFANFQKQHLQTPRSLCVWIGPEGDLAPQEIAAIQSAGALPVSLGPWVLRTETAAIYCLSILNYQLQVSR